MLNDSSQTQQIFTLKVNIMTVPQRQQYAEYLKQLTNGTIFIDHHKKGIWYNAKRAWSHFENCSHILVLQDDIILCDNFIPTVYKTISVFPDKIISYFTGQAMRRHRERAYQSKQHWMILDCTLTAQAVLMPIEIAKKFISWDDATFPNTPTAIDDHKFKLFQKSFKIPTYCTVPELVQHGYSITGVASTISKKEHDITAVHFRTNVEDISWKNLPDPKIHVYGFSKKIWAYWNNQ